MISLYKDQTARITTSIILFQSLSSCGNANCSYQFCDVAGSRQPNFFPVIRGIPCEFDAQGQPTPSILNHSTVSLPVVPFPQFPVNTGFDAYLVVPATVGPVGKEDERANVAETVATWKTLINLATRLTNTRCHCT
jgi:hypothetical protein